ncbi:ABC transporter permease [Paenibacillus contaminans]|uniref:Sugar ABC transporter permease n=1 Tax=Paenibacillus contaminans TaxID=450362 RepID=A0A329M805_9BACL|nr:ABC transporter permease subunit [Paenibacillus contaminans]RAV14823.1 sugar ABC transporter permease [Paenibacillus contaminans]
MSFSPGKEPSLHLSAGGTAFGRGKTAKEIWKNRHYYILLLPALLFFILFHYVPMAGIILAFKDFSYAKGIFGSEWVGLEHFNRLFGSNSFYEVLANTLIISFYRLAFVFVAPIIFAMLLNELRNVKFKRTVQTISYLPHFISWVVLGGIVMELLSPTRGIVNYFIQLFGFEPIYFLSSSEHFRSVLIVSDIWQSVGWGSIIYLAAIAGINPDQYESASIDGATRWQMAVKITIPSILPTIVILFIFQLGGIMHAGFDQIFNLYNPSVYKVADIIDTYVYRIGLVNLEYDYTTAVGLFKNVVGFILVILANIVTGRIREGEYRLW